MEAEPAIKHSSDKGTDQNTGMDQLHYQADRAFTNPKERPIIAIPSCPALHQRRCQPTML